MTISYRTPAYKTSCGRAMQEGQARLTVGNDIIGKKRNRVMSIMARDFSARYLPSIFSTQEKLFSESSLGLHFTRSLVDSSPSTLPDQDSPRETDFPLGPDEDFSLRYEKGDVILDTNIPARRQSRIRHDVRHRMIYDAVLEVFYSDFMFPELSVDPFVLSAERFGISLFYKELDFTKNRVVEFLQELSDARNTDSLSPYIVIDKVTSRYALPIKDNIDYTRSISDVVTDKSEAYSNRLFANIETMMAGHYESKGDDILFISNENESGRFKIPLHIASSSARGLSDLYFYLRHVARYDHLLIVDEPESHLDTHNQILLARLLASLVNSGLRVLITTHSDYLVKEINNLIMLDSYAPDEVDLRADLGYTEGESIKPASIRAYVAEAGTLIECDIDEFGISMPVFDDTIDSINTVSNALAGRLRRHGSFSSER